MTAKVTALESGYDFFTLYFEDPITLRGASKRFYNYLPRVNFEHLELQRVNMTHKPGDVPHFHNGIAATKGPHFHIIYPDRPTNEDIELIKSICNSRLVDINIPTDMNIEEIS